MNSRRTITFLQINDTHGYLEPHPGLFWAGAQAEYRTAGGYSRLLTIFKRVRQEWNGAVIALDNGDTFHGTFHAVDSEGEALIEPVNLLGLDAWTVHWDFAYGPDRMRELASKLNYPLLACNCHVKTTGELAYPAFTVIGNPGHAEKIRTQAPRSGTACHRRPQALLRVKPVRERGSPWHGVIAV